jgi:integrase
MIEKIKRKKGHTYRARINLPNGKRTSKTFKRRVDAEKWETQMQYQVQTGSLHGSKLNLKMTFAELVAQWYRAKIRSVKSQRTQANYKSDIRKHLLPFVGSIQIQKIERGHGDRLVELMKDANYAAKTINKLIGIFRQILNYAVDEQLLNVNPLTRYPSLKVPPRGDVFLMDKEIQQLLVHNNHHWIYPILVIALNTGMRRGEILGLCWDRVNFETGFIEVTRNLTREGLQETTKTNSKRIVPMNDAVRDILIELMTKQLHPKRVFVDDKRQPIDVSHFTYRHFRPALQRAGLRKVRFHDLRHTYASQYMIKGGNIYDLQKILGHSELKITSQYAHLSPDHLKGAGNVVSYQVLKDVDPQTVHKIQTH